MKHLLKILILPLFAATLTSCSNRSQSAAPEACEVAEKFNSIYHWKTTFEPTAAEIEFLSQHNVKRIYMRMFDVAIEQDFLNGGPEIVPIATTKFASAPPKDIEIVPVTYITIDALRAMYGDEPEYAPLIVERLLAMASYNGCGEIREIQLDCDWTSSTKSSYHRLCQIVKEILNSKQIKLSITIRLHQLQESALPADKGVLMLYNTGALKNPRTTNSILDITDVKPYIKSSGYPIPLNYAYPAFGWGVKFENDKFVSIVSAEAKAKKSQEHIRHERPTVTEILAVKELVEQHLGKPLNGNILYHFDNNQLKNYSNDEISQIYAY